MNPPIEQVSADAKGFLQKAIDSEKFCVFVAYAEDGKMHFYEGRFEFPAGDLEGLNDKIDEVIRKAREVK